MEYLVIGVSPWTLCWHKNREHIKIYEVLILISFPGNHNGYYLADSICWCILYIYIYIYI